MRRLTRWVLSCTFIKNILFISCNIIDMNIILQQSENKNKNIYKTFQIDIVKTLSNWRF